MTMTITKIQQCFPKAVPLTTASKSATTEATKYATAT